MDFSSNYVRILRKETFLAFRRETSMLKFPQEIVDMYKDLKPAHQKIYRIIRDTIFPARFLPEKNSRKRESPKLWASAALPSAPP